MSDFESTDPYIENVSHIKIDLSEKQKARIKEALNNPILWTPLTAEFDSQKETVYPLLPTENCEYEFAIGQQFGLTYIVKNKLKCPIDLAKMEENSRGDERNV